MPNASRESAASDRPCTTNSRKCDCSRTLAAGILQIATDAKAVRRCALTLPGMTAIEYLHDDPPFPVIERATTLVRKRHQTGRLNSYESALCDDFIEEKSPGTDAHRLASTVFSCVSRISWFKFFS